MISPQTRYLTRFMIASLSTFIGAREACDTNRISPHTSPTHTYRPTYVWWRDQVKQVAAARDGGRERMLAAVLRTLGACAEDNSANASRVIAARGVMPSFQLLNSRLSTIRREAAFTVACLFQSGASKADAEELINVEGRLMHYLVDGITEGRERDQAYAAILLARLLTHVRTIPPVLRFNCR